MADIILSNIYRVVLELRKEIEFESRLLNILYSHIAFIMQLGSITNLILILHILQFLDLSE